MYALPLLCTANPTHTVSSLHSKKRGKRAAEPTDESSSKKAKGEEELTAYEKEVKRLNNSTLKDSGYDMRPMLK